MSDISNNVSFHEKEQLKSFRGDYQDPMGNLWIIDVVGAPDEVDEFAKSQPFSLEATPITQEDLQQAKEEARYSDNKPDSEPPSPSAAAEGMPGLQVTCYLVDLQIPAPYRVHFEVDPKPYYYHGFHLQGADTTANITYNASSGTVQVCVSTPSGNVWSQPSAKGKVSKSGVQRGSSCSVSVSRSSGNPRFTLSGDWYVA